MEISLPSGNTVSLRDQFMRGDLVAAKRALKITIEQDGSRHMTGAIEDEVIGAILRSMITGWTFPSPLPSQTASAELAEGVLNSVLDSADYDVIVKAVQPFTQKVLRTPQSENPNSKSGTTVISISAEPDGQETLNTQPTLS